MRRKQNPDSSGILWGVILAGAAYFAYEYWLAPQAAASTVVAAAAPAATGTPTSNPAPSAVVTPPLGSTVSGAANVALQAAANYPYIVPDAQTFSSTSVPSGYNVFDTSDMGNVYLRNNIYQAVTASTASAATATSNATQNSVTLAQIEAIMTAGGLSGVLRGLHGLFPMYQRMGWN